MGADLFESFVGGIIAAMVLGSQVFGTTGAALPLWCACIGIFGGIIGDLYPNLEIPPVDYGALQVAIEEAQVRNGLQIIPKFVVKTIELYQTLNVRFGVMEVGPTGGGKTLAGFMPSLEKLVAKGSTGKLHTLYMSPLKALAVDIQRNLMQPVDELALDISIETRSGDTPQNRKTRQKQNPPDILLTTPEQLALMLSWPEADDYFAALDTIIIDELHALAPNKRGDLLALGLARLARRGHDRRGRAARRRERGAARRRRAGLRGGRQRRAALVVGVARAAAGDAGDVVELDPGLLARLV